MTIYIHCPCAEEDENQVDKEGKTKETATVVVGGLKSQYARHFLHNLYFCEDCLSIRCPRCISTEVVSWYCPTCLYTMSASKIVSSSSSTTTSSSNNNMVPPQFCPRQCYNCPTCKIHMGVSVIDGKRTLQCPYCKWSPTTRRVNNKDDDDDNRYSQLVQYYNNAYDDGDFLFTREQQQQQQQQSQVFVSDDVAESQYYPAYQSPNLQSKVTPLGEKLKHMQLRHILSPKSSDRDTGETILIGNNKSPSSRGGIARYNGYSPLQARYARIAQEHYRHDVGEEAAVVKLDEESDEAMTAFKQPQKQEMRAKYVKRCKVCRQCLVRPDAKGNSSKFRIKQMAMSVIPWISASLTVNNKLWITMTNPLFENVAVRLSTPANGSFTILHPTFELGASEADHGNNLQEAGRSLARGLRNGFKGQGAGNKDFVSGKDWISVAVAYNNTTNNNHVEMPLFVSLSYKANNTDGEILHQDGVHEVGLWVLIELNVD